MAKVKAEVSKILKEYGLDPREALWDCHGTWILLHTACQTIQHKLGIVFGEPKVLHMDMDKKTVVVQVFAQNKDGATRFELGEAAPSNNKNGYPVAMAMKRAEDKAIIHLAKLREHGIYSTEEADDFKKKPANRDQGVEAQRVINLLREATTASNINEIIKHHKNDLMTLPVNVQREVKKVRQDKLSELGE
tara:strand:+ start:4234 stop:4806 length:573 start_codon:yes stop_codon:yes gene_type:complete